MDELINKLIKKYMPDYGPYPKMYERFEIDFRKDLENLLNVHKSIIAERIMSETGCKCYELIYDEKDIT